MVTNVFRPCAFRGRVVSDDSHRPYNDCSAWFASVRGWGMANRRSKTLRGRALYGISPPTKMWAVLNVQRDSLVRSRRPTRDPGPCLWQVRRSVQRPLMARRLMRCGFVGSMPLGMPNPCFVWSVRRRSLRISSSSLVSRNLRRGCIFFMMKLLWSVGS